MNHNELSGTARQSRHRSGETRFLIVIKFIDIKLSVWRSPRLYSRLLLLRRTDEQHRFVWAAPENPIPGPPRAGRPITPLWPTISCRNKETPKHADGTRPVHSLIRPAARRPGTVKIIVIGPGSRCQCQCKSDPATVMPVSRALIGGASITLAPGHMVFIFELRWACSDQ